MLSKSDLRLKSKSLCADFLKSVEKSKLDEVVCVQIQNLLESLGSFAIQNNKPIVASYKAIQSEVSLDYLAQLCASQNKMQKSSHTTYNIAYPKVAGEKLEFFISDQFTNNSSLHNNSLKPVSGFQIPEPVGGQKVEIDQIDTFLVPGLAFNKKGQRLGRGKGYYDKTLKNSKSKKVGVGFSCQLFDEEIPHDEHDVDMDYIVTEKGVIKCKQ